MTTSDDYRAEYERLWNTTVDTLTAAVRLERVPGRPAEFAEFLTSALRATAANVGGRRTLTAGRPGSWESSLLDNLTRSILGDESSDIAQYRTEPVSVILNVEQLVDEQYHDRQRTTSIENMLGETALKPWNAAVDDLPYTENQADWDRQRTQLREQYSTAYAEYGQAFTEAVHNITMDLGITAPVTITLDTDPESPWWNDYAVTNPTDLDDDELAWKIWDNAIAIIGYPTLRTPPE